jgi:hypothetical protein
MGLPLRTSHREVLVRETMFSYALLYVSCYNGLKLAKNCTDTWILVQ